MAKKDTRSPLVGIIMGSQSDWAVMKNSCELLDQFNVPYESRIISAHRTPGRLINYAKAAESRGLKILIAGAGLAAGLPGMLAALTQLPVLGVPMEGKLMGGIDALLSMVQMPGGVAVGTFAVGKSGAINAALYSVQILSLSDSKMNTALADWRKKQTLNVPISPKED